MDKVGTITKIEVQKNDKQRCSIFVDGKFLLGIEAELVYEFHLEKGEVLTEEMLNQLLDQEELLNAKQAAFNLLSYRQRSTQELKERLLRKDYGIEIVNQVIHVLNKLEYLDDKEFATSWIKDRITKGYGPYRIRRQLKEKGVDTNIIEECLAEEYDSQLEYDLAAELAAKKRSRYNDEDYHERRYKLSKVLERKGFSFETINLVLDDLLTEGD
ncbi:RecX family transcriptional regulator [Halanaerobacter jeridensis]|uniref:Regulatory protein RecX n=1 Tax=Halanaerobacter jeridensis TaxID=706427 RepID=A0A939BNT2_9FIRM|nr:RecX family transcriptional regulator [Halanaerobacter jeridensis]MBM7556027.1 regulatory protein [Halanaerobacter jeridensis]